MDTRHGAYGGFLSYRHSDNDAERNRIYQLGIDIRNQYQLATGEDLPLFIDRDAIEWGDDWKLRIDDSINSVAFVIVIVTPGYLNSAECRRELQQFARSALKSNSMGHVLPILYSWVQALEDAEPSDYLVKLIQQFQWVDWRTLRHKSLDSEEYRSAVAEMAERLVRANKSAEVHGPVLSDTPAEDSTYETPGSIDSLAKMEESFPNWKECLSQLSAQITKVGSIVNEAAPRASAAANFSARLVLARKLAVELSDPIEQIFVISNEFVSSVHDVDPGIRIIISQLPAEVESNPTHREFARSFMKSMKGMTSAKPVYHLSPQKPARIIQNPGSHLTRLTARNQTPTAEPNPNHRGWPSD